MSSDLSSCIQFQDSWQICGLFRCKIDDPRHVLFSSFRTSLPGLPRNSHTPFLGSLVVLIHSSVDSLVLYVWSPKIILAIIIDLKSFVVRASFNVAYGVRLCVFLSAVFGWDWSGWIFNTLRYHDWHSMWLTEFMMRFYLVDDALSWLKSFDGTMGYFACLLIGKPLLRFFGSFFLSPWSLLIAIRTSLAVGNIV